MATEISRRDFMKSASALLGGFLFGGSVVKNLNNAPVPFLIGKVHSVDEVVRSFQMAQQGSLMASYAVFFPTFITKHMHEAPRLLSSTISKISSNETNYHRLEALPAVAAAHCLTQTIYDRSIEEELTGYISDKLNDERREVQEIVLQNLLSSVSIDYNTQFLTAPDSLLEAIGDVIVRAKESSKLVVPLCHSVQYLLTLRNIFSQLPSENNQKKLRKISSLLSEVVPKKGENLPEHFWFGQRLIQLWNELPLPNLNTPQPLIPHFSEALMGWPQMIAKYQAIVHHFMLLRIMNLYTAFETAQGADSQNLSIMSQDAAKLILNKMVAFDKTYKIDVVASQVRGKDFGFPVTGTMKGFKDFLEKAYWESLTTFEFSNTDIEYISRQRELALYVPLQKNDERVVHWEIWRNTQLNFWDYLGRVSAYLTGGILGKEIYNALEYVLKKLVSSKCVAGVPTDESVLNDKDLIEESAQKAAQDIELHCGQNLDDMDRKMGRFALDSKGNIVFQKK